MTLDEISLKEFILYKRIDLLVQLNNIARAGEIALAFLTFSAKYLLRYPEPDLVWSWVVNTCINIK